MLASHAIKMQANLNDIRAKFKNSGMKGNEAEDISEIS